MKIVNDLRDYATKLKDSTFDVYKKAVGVAKRYPKTAAIIGAATIIGTAGNEGFPPFHNIIKENGMGINIGFYTEVPAGRSFRGRFG